MKFFSFFVVAIVALAARSKKKQATQVADSGTRRIRSRLKDLYDYFRHDRFRLTKGDDPNPRTRCRTPSMPVSTKPRS